MQYDFRALQKKTERIIKKAARLMKESFTTTSKNGAVNIVTSADTAIQAFLKKELCRILPGSLFFGEEGEAKNAGGEYVWIVDPIDGTMNFARGIEACCISAALIKDEEAVLGVVYAPFMKKMYSAIKHGGAKCNGKGIHTSNATFAEAILCTALSLYRKEYADECMAVIGDAYAKCNDLRRFGSCALELCYVAEGKCDMLFEYRVFPWDHAAATLILAEAGGIAKGGNGNPLSYTHPQPIIAANNAENHNTLNDIVNAHVKAFPMEEALR